MSVKLCIIVLIRLFFAKTWIQLAESAGKHAIAINITNVNISARSVAQTNSTQHIASSRSTVEFDNSVNKNLTWKNEANCGQITVTHTHARIIGGSNAERGNWPWMAMILRYYVKNGFHSTCGGTLIRPQWVLTAGHCFFGDPTSYTHVLLGAYYKSLTEPSVRRFAIAKSICHHLFIGPSNAYEDDACLIKLAGEAVYTSRIKPVCLPTAGQSVVTKEICNIAGWGVTSTSTIGSETLQTAKVPIVSKAVCNQWYGDVSVTLPQNHFCAGYEAGGIDSCQGDSGGPLVCKRTVQKSQQVVQFGITSFGIGCAEARRPGVYTEVEKYTNWVETKIQENSGPEYCFNKSDLLSCGTKITKSGTVVRSPVDSSTGTWLYLPNQNCLWDIEAPPDWSIQLKFECFFHIEINRKNFSECYDYIRISSTKADFVSVYCGTTIPNPVLIASDTVQLSFHSDSSDQSSGFVIRVIFIAPPTIPVTNSSVLPNNTFVKPREKSSNISSQKPVSTSKCTNCGSGSGVDRPQIPCKFLSTLTLYFIWLALHLLN